MGLCFTKKILVIDDEKYALELIEIFLQDEVFEVITVNTEYEAWKKFELEEPDLVIMDIQMPGTDTLGLLKDKKHMLPVITHTGFDYHHELADWKNETDAFVVKKSDLGELINQVKRLIA